MTTLFPNLPALLKLQYAAALASRAIVFRESDAEDIEAGGIEFELRLLQAQGGKPELADGDAPAPTNPFEEPFTPELFVLEETVTEYEGDAGEQFVILLNKFPVIPRHFLLVTKKVASQSSPLTPLEIFTSYLILKQLGKKEKHLAFFNCGAESGMSQQHKHIQFIPLGVAPFTDFLLAHKPQNPKASFQCPLPYANFTACILPPPGASQEDLIMYLGGLMLGLLDLVIDHLRRLSLGTEGVRLSTLSYNVIITLDYIHLVPRTKERATLSGERSLSLNSLAFAGCLLVKSSEDLELVKTRGPFELLKEVGYTPVADGEAELEEEQ